MPDIVDEPRNGESLQVAGKTASNSQNIESASQAFEKREEFDSPDTESGLQGSEKKDELDPDAESGSIERVDDWDSPTNQDNPYNWPIGKKIFHTAIPALYGFVITVSTSAYVPAIPFIMQEYNVSREIAVLPLSSYTLGLTVGPIFAAPLSELWGRRMVYWTTMTLLLIFTGISSAANSVALLTVMRFFAGAGGSAALAVGAGSIADLFENQVRGRASVFFIFSPFLGPTLGPLTGAYIIHEYSNNWRWSQWVILIIAAPIAIMSLFMKETFKPRIQYLQRKKIGNVTQHKTGDTKLLLQKLRLAFIRPLHMMLIEPLVALLSIYTGFAFAMMFSFFGSYNYVFEIVYSFNDRQIGLTFLGVLVGFMSAVITFGAFDATLYRKAAVKARGRPAPEHRLYASMVGSLALPVGLFWWAWAPQKSVHWIVPVLAGIPFGLGSLTIFLSSTTYLVDVYQHTNGASAVAANGILRYLLGAIFPLFTIQMYQGMGIHWAGMVFACVSCLFLPVPWVFFFRGRGLRERSGYEVWRENE